MNNSRQRVWLSWLALGMLVVLCALLAVLQYRWIGNTTEAERNRLHGELHARLGSIARAFNHELIEVSAHSGPDAERWFRREAQVDSTGGTLRLQSVDRRTGRLSPMEWPAEWANTKQSLAQRWRGERMGPPPAFDAALVVLPRPGDRWLLLEPDITYIRSAVLPRLLDRYLGVNGKLDYDWQVAAGAQAATGRMDDSIALLDGRPGPAPAPAPAPQRDFEPGPPPPPPPDGGPARWRLFVRHSAGSLETLVEQTRRRNLAISAGVLLLILAALAALARFTRRAQQLAQLQMDFVAGVSHELRTPLTVIRTAAFNLRGKLAHSPAQVERYGALIQAESEKLEALVEQALRFASVEAGHTIGSRAPVSIAALLAADLRFENGAPEARVRLERHIQPHLPCVLGDRQALRQAIQNLVDNAMKYGAGEHRWIGVTASAIAGHGGPVVEIRVADHGPGIPADERRQIFDPFFRGRAALRDRVRGTGLGLSLAKKIVEAHGGAIRMHSEPGNGAEFVVCLPGLPASSEQEPQNEPAHSVS